MDFSNYSPKVQKYMNYVCEFLTKKYGKVTTAWEFQISLMADQLEMYYEISKVIKETGLYNAQNMVKNPLISSLKDCTATLVKQAQQFGLSPWAESKMKDTEKDDSENFIDNLTK
jgi:phage terminase small subunit